MPSPSSGRFVMTKSVHQHKIIKGGKLQKSEFSLIGVIIAEGSTNALPVPTSILSHFCIPVFVHNKTVLLRCLINDILQLVKEFFCCHHSLMFGCTLSYCDVERGCPQAYVVEPAGDWAASHDSVHDVLVKMKSNVMLLFITFFPLKKTMCP